MRRKLLLLGNNCIHTYNYFQLVKDYFDDILLLTDKSGGACENLPLKVLDYSPSPHKMLKAFWQTKCIINEYQPDIIHGQQINKALFFAVLVNNSLKIPVVATAWGSDILVIPRKNWLFRQIVRYILRNIPFFTSDSKYMAEQMEQIAERKLNITIANFGINMPEINVRKQDIIYSNRLHEKLYRIDAIIVAFSRFLKKNPQWKLVVAATGSETENLKHLTQTLSIADNVQFVGWLNQEQNFHYYALAKYWVSIPESDATAISLFEAMAMGCIPVVSDLPANREWVSNGENGIVVENVNDDFLSEVVDLDARKLVGKNKEIVFANATKEANRAKFLSIYDKILSV